MSGTPPILAISRILLRAAVARAPYTLLYSLRLCVLSLDLIFRILPFAIERIRKQHAKVYVS